MKKYGHTGTLFIAGGKYKWSNKFDYCIACKTCNSKHKGKGLCTKCFDIERNKVNKKRKIQNQIRSATFYYKNRILNFLVIKGFKKPGPKTNKTKEEINQRKKEWYQRNRKALNIINRGKVRKSKGLPCLTYNINDRVIYLPFTDLDKPKMTTDKEYDNWKIKKQEFEIVREYYLRKIK